MNLRRRAQLCDNEATVAQRIKRLPSIQAKLERFDKMRLSCVHDLGGCRAIVQDLDVLKELHSQYITGNGKHTLDRFDDYIFEKPKESGYRGYHFVYKYKSDRKSTYNNLKVEVQIRTRLQHAWATAVETVGFFTAQALKSSSGEEAWLRFFALMSSVIAARERTLTIPGTPTGTRELLDEVKRLTQDLGVVERLSAYGQTLQFTEDHSAGRTAKYILLQLDAATQNLTVFTFDALTAATDKYGALERSAALENNTDVVLVSVESMATLRRAYPNYFLDTNVFLEIVREAIE